MSESLFREQRAIVERATLMRVRGRVCEVSGLTLVAEGLRLPVGASCVIETKGGPAIEAQVVGFRGPHTIIMALGDIAGTGPGDAVYSSSSMDYVAVGRGLLGRIVDGMGRPIDGCGGMHAHGHYPAFGPAPAALRRRAVETPMGTGIRAIDALLTLGRGQRIGLYAGTGVGKSVLMGMIGRYTSADVTVVALVGERGREVGDFLRKELDERSLKKTVMVVSTSDESPLLRVRACFTATAIAEYFRDQGGDVLLLMDSVTRMAMAQRQIGLSAGEPPTTKGYPPSVFALLPRLIERAGRTERGSITGIYTVLVDADDINDPIGDATRGTLDGHVWLSRALANGGHYPAISVLDSISRVMTDIVVDEHRAAAQSVRRMMGAWAQVEDLVNLGAYVRGTNATIDAAVEMKPEVDAFLRQSMSDRAEMGESIERLKSLHERIASAEGRVRPAA